MSHSRRGFLAAAVTFVAASAFGASGKIQQQSGPPKPPAYPDDSVEALPQVRRPDPRATLKANERQIKNDVAQLREVVAQLQKSIDESDTKEVLPLDVMNKTDQIEKLAKQIRSLVRG